MRGVARLAVTGLWRSPARTLIRVAVLAAAVSLLGAMILFVYESLGTMTTTAVRSVPLDWQGPVGSYRQAVGVARATGHEADVQQATAAATAPFVGSSHTSPSVGVVRSAGGSILAVPPDYATRFGTMRFLRGGLVPGQVVLDQQLAATLQAGVGDRVTIQPTRQAHPLTFRVSGVSLVTAPDVVFQPLNPLLGPAPAQPPADVIVMPLTTFAATLAPAYPASSTAGATAAVPGAQTGVQWQVQAQVRPASLTGDPSSALAQATRIRNRVERDQLGRVQFVDNLGDGLNSAAGDALYAETLYIMLAVPGAIVALGLAYLAALSTVERDRRELALLRARGATRRHLFVFAALESACIGIIAGLLGACAALLTVRWAVGYVSVTAGRATVLLIACVMLATLGALAARVGTGLEILRGSISESRRRVRRGGIPLWQRLWLDVLALAASGLIYWLTASTGFSAVVNPDSNPTLSLSVYMFFAPALLWIGATLLLVRLRGRLLAWVARRASGERAITMPGFVLASAGRRGAAINRGLIVTGLLLAFGVNLGVFTATYNQQAVVDAQLTLGADVVVTAPPGAVQTHGLSSRVAAVSGVRSTTAVDHAYAYVGPDLQDTFGIDPRGFTAATSLRDSYFLGSSARQAMSNLASTPDGILVSKETITDYQLHQGDLLRLRVLDHRSGRFRIAPFHVVGVVQEFPSAPKDSFMVTNLAYLEHVTHGIGPNVVLAGTSGNPAHVAAAVAARVKPYGGTVRNIANQVRQTTSSITTVDLTGISRIEEASAIALAAAAMALFVALGMAERRQELAAMAAVGASLRQVAAFLWSEAVIVLGGALVLALGLGWLLSEMLIAMLQHVFDPPPDHLAVPWAFLGGLAGAAVAAGVLASVVAFAGLRRMSLGAILREE